MSWVGAGATVLGAGIGAYGASQSGGDAQGSELPWYINSPTRAYFNRMSPNYPNEGGPRPHGGFLGQYDPKVFKGDTLANASSGYKDAMQAYGQVGYDPNSSTSQAEQFYQDQVAGDYLGMNSAMRQAVMNPAIDEVSSRFAKAGRGGINPNNTQAQLSAGLSSLMPFHNQALNRQMDAASVLPEFDTMRMDRSSVFGDYQMRQQQGEINDAMRIHDFRNNKYLDQMKQWQSLLNPNTGYAPAPPTQQQPDYLSAALGGGLMGNQLYQNYQGGQANPGSGQGVTSLFGDTYSDPYGSSPSVGNGINAMFPSYGGG